MDPGRSRGVRVGRHVPLRQPLRSRRSTSTFADHALLREVAAECGAGGTSRDRPGNVRNYTESGRPSLPAAEWTRRRRRAQDAALFARTRVLAVSCARRGPDTCPLHHRFARPSHKQHDENSFVNLRKVPGDRLGSGPRDGLPAAHSLADGGAQRHPDPHARRAFPGTGAGLREKEGGDCGGTFKTRGPLRGVRDHADFTYVRETPRLLRPEKCALALRSSSS